MRIENGMAETLPVSVPIVAPRIANAAIVGEYMRTARYMRMAVGAWLVP
jgi:hypothetical protein